MAKVPAGEMKLTELKRASIFDILKFNKPKIIGTIKLP